MKISDKVQSKLTSAFTPFLIQSALIFLVRAQLMVRTPQISQSFLSLLTISSADILLAFLISLGLGLATQSKKILLPIHFLLSVALFLPVFFQIKMGIPLSVGLLKQVGGVFELKTSITDHSNSRNIFMFIAIIMTTTILMSVVLFLRTKIYKFKSIIFSLTLMAVATATAFQVIQSPTQKQWSYSFLLQVIQSSKQEDKISTSELLKQVSPLFVTNVDTEIDINKKPLNVILVILETFDYSLIKDPNIFQKIMPNLFKRSPRALSYSKHYTPWPFSSKSLYSIICGKTPYPSRVIELRVRPNVNCQGWLGSLEKSGYQLWTGYSGDMAYDRMGVFFKHQANTVIEDRFTLSRYKLEEWELGVDDKALVYGIRDFIDNRDKNKPFATTLIPINSHHPYWTPSGHKTLIEDPFQNSFHYQDQLIEEIFVMLGERNLLDSTAVIITGDHGRREGTQLIMNMINEEMYHVPLFIFTPDQTAKGIVSHATSHMDIKGTILKLANLKGNIIKNNELSLAKDFMIIYDLEHMSFLLKDENQNSTLLNLDTNMVSCSPKDPSCKIQLEKIKGLLINAEDKYKEL